MAKTIDITPTWQQATQIFIAALMGGKPKGQQAAKIELLRLAKMGDSFARMQQFGTKENEAIILVDESRLTVEFIGEIREYLDTKEKELKK